MQIIFHPVTNEPLGISFRMDELTEDEQETILRRTHGEFNPIDDSV